MSLHVSTGHSTSHGHHDMSLTCIYRSLTSLQGHLTWWPVPHMGLHAIQPVHGHHHDMSVYRSFTSLQGHLTWWPVPHHMCLHVIQPVMDTIMTCPSHVSTGHSTSHGHHDMSLTCVYRSFTSHSHLYGVIQPVMDTMDTCWRGFVETGSLAWIRASISQQLPPLNFHLLPAIPCVNSQQLQPLNSDFLFSPEMKPRFPNSLPRSYEYWGLWD